MPGTPPHAVSTAAIIAAAFALVAAPSAAVAATPDDSVTWAVTPADANGGDSRSWVEAELDPGETVTDYLAVSNLGASTTTFELSAADGYFTETGRFNMLQSGQTSVDAGTWITIASFVEVEPGATEIVPFTISVPENATPGDHPAGVAASVTTTGTTSDGAQIGVDSRVGFRVITQVTGTLAPALSLSEVSGDYVPSWNPFTPGRIDVRYEVTNSGNTQLSFDDTTLNATTARGDLFPGETRSVAVEPTTAWPLGPLSVEVVVAGAVPSDDSLAVASVSRTITVWAIPWAQLALLAAIALVAVLLVLSRRRSSAKLDALLEQARAEGRREREHAVHA